MRGTRNFLKRRSARGRFARQQGFILISCYMVVAVLLVLQSAYFSRIVEDAKLSTDYIDHVKTLHLADAALDQAIVSLNSGPAYNGTGGKVVLGAGEYAITVNAHPSDNTLRIVDAFGYYPAGQSAQRQEHVQALVRVSAKLFNYGLFGDSWLRMVGSTTVNGGYNSSLGQLPSGQLSAPADLGTNGTGVGDMRFTGSLTGPYSQAWCGQGTIAPAPNYCVQINGSSSYLGAAVMTQQNSLPTVTAPQASYSGVVLNINGGIYTLDLANPYVFHPAGDPAGYYAVVLDGLSVSGNATVRVGAGITRLNMYVNNSLSLAGSGTIGDTTTYKATQLIVNYLGTSTATVGGGGVIVAGVFAKNAQVTMTGGATIYGAVAAKQISGNGSYAFTFDQGLRDLAIGQGSAAKLLVWERQ